MPFVFQQSCSASQLMSARMAPGMVPLSQGRSITTVSGTPKTLFSTRESRLFTIVESRLMRSRGERGEVTSRWRRGEVTLAADGADVGMLSGFTPSWLCVTWPFLRASRVGDSGARYRLFVEGGEQLSDCCRCTIEEPPFFESVQERLLLRREPRLPCCTCLRDRLTPRGWSELPLLPGRWLSSPSEDCCEERLRFCAEPQRMVEDSRKEPAASSVEELDETRSTQSSSSAFTISRITGELASLWSSSGTSTPSASAMVDCSDTSPASVPESVVGTRGRHRSISPDGLRDAALILCPARMAPVSLSEGKSWSPHSRRFWSNAPGAERIIQETASERAIPPLTRNVLVNEKETGMRRCWKITRQPSLICAMKCFILHAGSISTSVPSRGSPVGPTWLRYRACVSALAAGSSQDFARAMSNTSATGTRLEVIVCSRMTFSRA
mmetsp:Transcript_15763/g.61583  ORF Transcript_15763/g.61583 Transcript_15763/m.61583 type:complete len:440 (+) Transcript_15763:863-2182(+)